MAPFYSPFCSNPQIKFNVGGQELVVPLEGSPEDVDCESSYTTEVVRRVIAAKDQGLISDKSYHELRMAFPEDTRGRIPTYTTYTGTCSLIFIIKLRHKLSQCSSGLRLQLGNNKRKQWDAKSKPCLCFLHLTLNLFIIIMLMRAVRMDYIKEKQ